jgi:tetratricopeptide (TPR) repeat protein
VIFDIETGQQTWTVTGVEPFMRARRVPDPYEGRLGSLTETLRSWANKPVSAGDRSTKDYIDRLALQVSGLLTALLFDENTLNELRQRLTRERVSLTIRAHGTAGAGDLASDQALALPWELLSPDPGTFPVLNGRLIVVREAVAEGAPELTDPVSPFTLAVVIAAPEGEVSFPYEREAVRLFRALSALGHRAIFTELGRVVDLVELVEEYSASAIHFRGEGLPGGLLFENDLGFTEKVAAKDLIRRLASVLLAPSRAGSFPGLFFLSSPFSAVEMSVRSERRKLEGLAAAAIHRVGFAQVIGYFGPVDSELSTQVEQAFYRALASGRTTLQAADAARRVLCAVAPPHAGRPYYPLAWSQLAVYHRGPDRPLCLRGRGLRNRERMRSRTLQVNRLPVLEQGFIGRRGLLYEILRRIQKGQSLIVLQGLGGMGKTALASHLLTRFLAPESSRRLVLACQGLERMAEPLHELRTQAEEHGSLHRFHQWAEKICELRQKFPEPTRGFVEVIRELRRERPDLVIYIDNAESLQGGPLTDQPQALGNWRPGVEEWWRHLQILSEEAHEPILISTRYGWEGLASRVWIGVGPLIEADSLRLISSFEPLGRLSPEIRGALAERVDGHPRTIELLNNLVAKCRKEIRKTKVDLWKEIVAHIFPETVRKIRADLVVSQLWASLSKEGQRHARRLGVLRTTAPRPVIDSLGNARDELIRAGLLTRYRVQILNPGSVVWSDRWGLHGAFLGFVVARTRRMNRQDVHRVVAEAYERFVQTRKGSNWFDQKEAIDHFLAIKGGDRAWPLVQEYVLWLRSQARYPEALNLLETMESAGTTGENLAATLILLCQMKDLVGGEDEELFALLDRAASVASADAVLSSLAHERSRLLMHRGKLVEAEALLRSLLAAKDLGRTQDPSYSSILHTLAQILIIRGRYDEAEPLLRRSVGMDQAALDPGHPDRAPSLLVLARVLERLGQYEEAESLARQALSLWEESSQPDHPSLAFSLLDLAMVQINRGRYSEAEGILRHSLSIGEASGDPVLIATILHALSGVLRAQGRAGEAEIVVRRSLTLAEVVFGPEHPETGMDLHELALTLDEQGRSAEAEPLLRRAVVIAQNGKGEGHPDHCNALRDLAAVLKKLGKNAESKSLLHRCLDLDVGPGRDLGRAAALHELADLFLNEGRADEAIEILREALPIVEQWRGKDHPDYAVFLHTLGDAFYRAGRLDEAEAYLRTSISLKERALGVDHLEVAISLTCLAKVLREGEDLTEAEAALQSALSIKKESLGEMHPSYAISLYELARLFGKQKRFAEAEALLRQVLSILEATVGVDHPNFEASLHALAVMVASQERYQEAQTIFRKLPRRK